MYYISIKLSFRKPAHRAGLHACLCYFSTPKVQPMRCKDQGGLLNTNLNILMQIDSWMPDEVAIRLGHFYISYTKLFTTNRSNGYESQIICPQIRNSVKLTVSFQYSIGVH